MKYTIKILAAFLLFASTAKAQENVVLNALEGPIPFSFLYGGSLREDMRNNIANIEQTADGGYIMVGSSASSASGHVSGTNKGNSDAWIIKTDALGKIQWEKLYGGSDEDAATAVKQTSDGGYIVTCFTRSSNSGDVGTNKGRINYWILKLDSLGNIVWNKMYGGSYDDTVNDVLQVADGGYLVIGTTNSSDGDHSQAIYGVNLWLLKLDASGNKLWDKRYGGRSGEQSSKIIPASDGGYIILSYTRSSASFDVTGTNKGSTDIWILKINAAGIKQWDKMYGGNAQDESYSIRETAGGGYIIAGFTSSSLNGDVTGTNNGGYDAWFLKLDAAGNKQWDRIYGTALPDKAYDIVQMADQGYMAVGSNNNIATIWRLDSSGMLVWQKQYGRGGLVSIKPTADSKFIIGGISSQPTGYDTHNGVTDFWIMKIDSAGDFEWVPAVGQ